MCLTAKSHIEIQRFLGCRIPIENLCARITPLYCKVCLSVALCIYLPYRFGEAFHATRVDEESRIACHLRDRGNVGRNDGDTTAHGLQDWETKTLIERETRTVWRRDTGLGRHPHRCTLESATMFSRPRWCRVRRMPGVHHPGEPATTRHKVGSMCFAWRNWAKAWSSVITFLRGFGAPRKSMYREGRPYFRRTRLRRARSMVGPNRKSHPQGSRPTLVLAGVGQRCRTSSLVASDGIYDHIRLLGIRVRAACTTRRCRRVNVCGRSKGITSWIVTTYLLRLKKGGSPTWSSP